jgi:hypothetical protein
MNSDGFSHLVGMKEREAAQWLQEWTSEVCWGRKKFDSEKAKFIPKYVNLNKDLVAWLSYGKHRFTLPRNLTQKALLAHFRNEAPGDTLYFTGSWGNRSLLMIDIDCHGSGTLQGAIEFAEYLRDTYFQHLYFEPSTNGNGVHGYLLVKDIRNSKDFNKAAKLLDRWLKAVLSKTTFDVEDVEIKGTCAVVERHNGQVVNFTEGTLAKYPRDVSRFDEWKQTTSLSVEDIWSLIETSSVRPMPKKEARRSGSIAGKHIDTETITALLSFGMDVLGQEQVSIGSKNRAVVTAEDVAVLATLLKFFTDNRNADGSLPVARIRSLWKSLYECGDITRAWDHHRFMWLRDKFTALGLIDWEDATYVVGDKENGVVGQACKWSGSEKLLAIISEYTSTVNNADAATSAIIREERGILGWSNLLKEESSTLSNGNEEAEIAIVRPIRVFKMPWRWEDNIEKVNRIVQETMKRLELLEMAA